MQIPDSMLTDVVDLYTEATLEAAANPQSNWEAQAVAGTGIAALYVPLSADEQMTIAGAFPDVTGRFCFGPGAPVADRTIIQFVSGSQTVGTRYVVRGDPLPFAVFSPEVHHIETLVRELA